MDILQHFEQEKSQLRKQLEAEPDREHALRIVRDYFTSLHRELAKSVPLHKARQLNALLDAIYFALGSVGAVDKHVKIAPLAIPSPSAVPDWMLTYGKGLQAAIIILLLFALFNASPLWIALISALILLALEKYLQSLKYQEKPSLFFRGIFFLFRKKIALPTPSSTQVVSDKLVPQVDVQLQVDSQAFLNYLADALSVVQKIFAGQEEQQEDTLFEKEPQLLAFFQELFEAYYFNDGAWALKKIPTVTAFLRKHDIEVTTFHPDRPEDTRYFDVEPAIDAALKEHITIRPAFVKGKQVILRGQAAEPLSEKA
ncbi:hypothetical protein U27_05517 [Candidatus Vecturithrix granuli]|uniref:Uncharacterized protein n=1 Tax=Vecturithrix granuli TaxID=1499967 RepID=A0A081C1T8_VECG1|nr:hypothetical protein U27_05517 [Candidatus Vecturithrix granuli]